MIRAWFLVLIVSLQVCCQSARAQDPQNFDPVKAGARGLARSANFPWYDDDTGNAVPVDVQPSRDSLDDRSSDWTQKPKTNQPPRWNWNWGNWSRGATNVFEVIGWIALAALIIALVVILGWALMQREQRRGKRRAMDPEHVGKEAATAQIENLPFPLEPTELDLLAEARKHFQAGDYEKAIIYLFSYQLVQLDHRQLLRLARGKTNRQYLRELRPQPTLRALLEQTMIRFEEVFFGGRNLTQAQFAHCWDRLGEFHQHVEQPAT